MKMVIEKLNFMPSTCLCENCGNTLPDESYGVFIEEAEDQDEDIGTYYCSEICLAMCRDSLVQHFLKKHWKPDIYEMIGKEQINAYFGLTYASWLTLPRVLMQEMPGEWQTKMHQLLSEYDETMKHPPNLGTRVQVTNPNNQMVKTPEWLLNYRHPNKTIINTIKGVKNNENN